MRYPFSFPAPVTVLIAGSADQFPVRRIYCIGRNYADHAREMGGDPTREAPFYFAKPADAIVASGSTIAYACGTKNLAYEIELVVAIGKAGKDIAVAQALEHVYGYAVGLDLTRRDLQGLAKDKGRPWEAGKGFDQSAPISAIHPVAAIGHPLNSSIWFKLNGELKQDAHTSQMTWSVAEVIAHLSQLNQLMPGDLIFTGTPAGVGAIQPGDHLHGGVDGVDEITLRIAAH
ncbi:fumarylacetoacetate hydrolase family protein [Ampullimonas aquatilis]|uniref:fumarylacetoacetate hydrolase family protein n=1 Tax=Ampullimonas aquatilis TaxID=1341549 RepID=UPI003C7079B4